MRKTIIDGVEIGPEDLSNYGREQLQQLQGLDMQMAHLKNDVAAYLAMYETARGKYLQEIRADLARSANSERTSTSKFVSFLKRRAGV